MKLHEQWAKQQREELGRLLDWAGSQTNLATFLGVSAQVVNAWVKRGRISAAEAIRVQELTGGEFQKRALRPDVHSWRDER